MFPTLCRGRRRHRFVPAAPRTNSLTYRVCGGLADDRRPISAVVAETRRLTLFGRHHHLPRPARMAEREVQPCVQSVRTEGAVHRAIELALDHHADQARAKTGLAH